MRARLMSVSLSSRHHKSFLKRLQTFDLLPLAVKQIMERMETKEDASPQVRRLSSSFALEDVMGQQHFIVSICARCPGRAVHTASLCRQLSRQMHMQLAGPSPRVSHAHMLHANCTHGVLPPCSSASSAHTLAAAAAYAMTKLPDLQVARNEKIEQKRQERSIEQRIEQMQRHQKGNVDDDDELDASTSGAQPEIDFARLHAMHWRDSCDMLAIRRQLKA